MQSQVGEISRDVEIQGSGSHPGTPGQVIHFPRRIEAGHHQEERRLNGDGATGQPGPRPAGDDRNTMTLGNAHAGCHFLSRLRENGGQNLARGHTGVLVVDPHLQRMGMHAIRSEDSPQIGDKTHGKRLTGNVPDEVGADRRTGSLRVHAAHMPIEHPAQTTNEGYVNEPPPATQRHGENCIGNLTVAEQPEPLADAAPLIT